MRDIVQISTLEEFLRARGPIERAQREGLKRAYRTKRGPKVTKRGPKETKRGSKENALR